MPIVTAGIFPHGSGLIYSKSKKRNGFRSLSKAMRKASRLVYARKPDTVVIMSPHNLRLRENIGVVVAERCSGLLIEKDKTTQLSFNTDKELAEGFYNNAKSKGIRVVAVNYGTDQGPFSCMPLDWGTLIPMYFLRKLNNIVLITPSRELPWTELFEFGRCIAEVSEPQKRIAIIASADQAHAHRSDGPYGYDEAAVIFDEFVQKLVAERNLEGFLRIPQSMVSRAKPDSIWQMLILAGALHNKQIRLLMSHYARPTYYGMLLSLFDLI